ncbi:GT2 family glycosyltransferase [Streptomyces sp. SLBN-118]|uniref:glycosyltransferase n=1 Tax=Streptomyces sp. SLBN-118 TaxID=2768454 RepID=UPI001167DE17|nr:glycosyltransferase [Streptomyces sp. SLBN-118]TQK50808.1 GT2 family glycosyltransferase [Streptomyces sp. SLBN-118]
MNAAGPRIPTPDAAVSVPAAPPYTPARIVDIDLAEPGDFRPPGSLDLIRPQGRVMALVRLHGHPLGMVSTTGAGPVELWQSLANAAHRDLTTSVAQHLTADGPSTASRDASLPWDEPAGLRCQAARLRALREATDISVIVATHNRPEQLRQCLDSLLQMEYPRFEVIVVDNAPANGATEQLVHEVYGRRVRYVREPAAGLARAHNRGLAAARGRIAAFTDDDTLVDSRWLTELAAAFSSDPRIGCVTGLIVPAELQTRAQAALERHGGFAKGYTPRTWSLDNPPADPLFPFTAGRFGSGANMAFRTDLLHAMGGFDPATGTGTPARGGDDLLAFFRVLVGGHTLAYQPGAIVWHRHHRTEDALKTQAFGYGAGLGAYLTGALANEPRMLPALLRRLPGGIQYAAAKARGRKEAGDGWSRRLAVLEMKGLLYGPLGYLRSRASGRSS